MILYMQTQFRRLRAAPCHWFSLNRRLMDRLLVWTALFRQQIPTTWRRSSLCRLWTAITSVLIFQENRWTLPRWIRVNWHTLVLIVVHKAHSWREGVRASSIKIAIIPPDGSSSLKILGGDEWLNGVLFEMYIEEIAKSAYSVLCRLLGVKGSIMLMRRWISWGK